MKPLLRLAEAAALLTFCVAAVTTAADDHQTPEEQYLQAMLDGNKTFTNMLLDSPWSIIYPAVGAAPLLRAVVFTDPTCPHSRRLHRDLEQLSAAGIEVQYSLFSRTAPPRPSRADMDWLMHFWCLPMDERVQNADMLFLESRLPQRMADCDEEVAEMLSRVPIEVGHATGVQGTPTIYFDTGHTRRGYRDADSLIANYLPDASE